MKFKTCYLHIGVEKTGSTTIQRFLEKNRKKLNKKGHYYPSCLGPAKGSHYYLVVYSRHEDIFDDLRLISGVSNKQEFVSFRKQLIKDIEKEFSEVEECDAIHISCENFHSRLFSPEAMKMVKELLQSWVDDFKVVAYVRPQHEVALSLYSTGMKLGGIKTEPMPKVDKYNHYYNYEVMLNKWASVFEYENVIVRNFQRHTLYQNDVVLDYLNLTGILPEGLQTIEKENESLTPEALEFLGALNKYLPRFVDNKPTNIRKNLASIMEKVFPGKGATTSRENAKNFYSIFQSSNAEVARSFFKKDDLFELDFTKYSEELSFNVLNNEDLIAMIAKILNNTILVRINDNCKCSEKLFKLFSDEIILDKNIIKDFLKSELCDIENNEEILMTFSEIWKCCTFNIKV